MNSYENERWVTEQWWHRLSRVLMYASTTIIGLISGFWFIVNAEYSTYSYSFEPTYDTKAGEEHECFYSASLGISCGDLSSTTGFLSSFLIHKAKDKCKVNENMTIGDLVELFRDFHSTDDQIVQQLFEGDDPCLNIKDVQYRQESHWNHKEIAAGIGYSAGISVIWYGFTFLIYKTILFIAHGHTNLRRTYS